MSNVLIGIIGVILFIGLALAGALFLGPRFQESTIASKASAWTQGQAQVAHAVNLMRLNEGSVVQADYTSMESMKTLMVDSGYMKSVPVNPAGIERYYVLRGPTGGFGGPATYVMNGFFLGNKDDERLCTEIARRAGITIPADGSPPVLTAPVGQFGCFRNNSGYAGEGVSLYAYTRI
jgi:hypothetical protein